MKKLLAVIWAVLLAAGVFATAPAQELELHTDLTDVFVSDGGRLVLSNPTSLRGMNRWAFFNLAVSSTNVYNFDDSVATISGRIDTLAPGSLADYIVYKVVSPAQGTLDTSPAGSEVEHLMTIYVWKDLKGVLISCRLRNNGNAPLSGKTSFELYPRIDQSYNDHSLRFRAQDSIAYFYRGTLAHFVAAKSLSARLTGVRLSAAGAFFVSGTVAESQPDSVRYNAANYTGLDASTDSPSGTRSMVHLNTGAVTLAANDSSAAYYFAMAYDVDEAGALQAVRDVEARYRARFPTAVAGRPHTLPAQYTLHQNHPNPFNPTTQIRFDLAERDQVRLVVYDNMGRALRTLWQGQTPAGTHVVTLDTAGWTSGVYFYTLHSTRGSVTRKMVLLQ